MGRRDDGRRRAPRPGPPPAARRRRRPRHHRIPPQQDHSLSPPSRNPVAEVALAFASYLKIGWWGLVAPRLVETEPLVVLQAVVRGERGVLLAIRSDLRGWELPGGTLEPGEDLEQALCREVREETGLAVAVERHVGDYRRTGFRPHTAKVYVCRVTGGALETSRETRALRWFAPEALPETLFPWYRGPLADALRASGVSEGPVARTERQGLRAVLAGIGIDLRMRASGDRAGLPGAEGASGES